MDSPLLSVCLITYNHKDYIAQAIEGVLMQKVNFTWELIIADDCSTDGTREIILEYKERYPEFIKLMLQPNNVGPARNWLDLISAPKSKYIAYIEGDDYWTDPLKLRKQIDFLESEPAYSICSTNALVKHDSTNVEIEWLGKDQKSVSELTDLLRNGSGGASCTLVFRTNIIKHIPPWVAHATGAEWLLQIFAVTPRAGVGSHAGQQ